MQWLIPAAIVGAALVLGGKASARPSDKDGKLPMDQARRKLRCAIAAAGMGDDWLRFLETTAKRESNFNHEAWNDSPGEVKASQRAVDRTRERLEELGGPPDDWAYGSKGLFQFLGPYVILKSKGFRFPVEIANPEMAMDPGVSVAAAFDFARGLMQFPNYNGTWASLRVGWGLPAKMGDPKYLESRGRAMEDRAAKLGWKRGWINERPTPLPKRNPDEMLVLSDAASTAWEACE